MAEKKIICPLMGGEECVQDGAIRNNELVACRFWIRVVGEDPQTKKMHDHYDCSFAWMPVLMIENSKVNRETGASIDSFRNEMVEANARGATQLLKLLGHEPNIMEIPK